MHLIFLEYWGGGQEQEILVAEMVSSQYQICSNLQVLSDRHILRLGILPVHT